MNNDQKMVEKQIFTKQLEILKDKHYIGHSEYEHVKEGFQKYCQEQDLDTTPTQSFAEKMRNFQQQRQPNSLYPPNSIPINPEQHRQNPVSSDPIQPVNPAHTKQQKQLIKKTKQARPHLTAEQVRERNISWSLNIGVIMLLLGGLFVATTNWATMPDWLKVLSIGFISILFYGIASIAYKLLKIDKTAFAFLVLGSLFLPIFILSVGWYEVLGSYLSVGGEGKFLLGFIGSLLVFPVYGWITIRLNDRLFAWFSLITLAATAGFLFKALGAGTDLFYLSMVVFNLVIILLISELRKRDILLIFTKELVPFSQVQLLLTTFLMLLFYDNPVFYGFNIILAASVYLAMIYVSGKKNYHFVFSLMFVYGAYQFLDNGLIDALNPIGYAALGFAFLLIPKLFEEDSYIKKAFHITSGIVSVFSFLYISVEALFLRLGEPSYIVVLAYIMIAGNFLYLAQQSQKALFRYLSSIFLAASLHELLQLIEEVIHFDNPLFARFFIGFVLFVVFGWLVKWDKLSVIRASSRDIGLIISLAMIYISLPGYYWWEIGVMLILSAGLFYIVLQIETRKAYLQVAPWFLPIAFGLSLVSFYQELYEYELSINHWFTFAVAFIFAGVLLAAISSLWKKVKNLELSETSFYTSQGFNGLALVISHMEFPENLWGHVILWSIGSAMLVLLYKKTNWKPVPFLLPIALIYVYVFTLEAADVFKLPPAVYAYFPILGAVILFALGLFIKKEAPLSKGFYVIGQIYLITASIFTLKAHWDDTFGPMAVAFVIYTISFMYARKEWTKKAMLYGCFTSLFILVLSLMDNYIDWDYPYAFLVSSIIIGLFWLKSDLNNRNRTNYYLIPFSIIGLYSFMFFVELHITLYVFAIFYTLFLLYFIHSIKWQVLAIIPLLLMYSGTLSLDSMSDWDTYTSLIILLVHGLVLLIAGQRIFPKILQSGTRDAIRSLDVYTLVSFIYMASAYTLAYETYIAEVIPGLLIALAIWLQRDRLTPQAKPFIVIIAGIYLLQPYYSLQEQFAVPSLLEREMIILPWLVSVIFIQRVLREKYRKITDYLQWGVLGLISILLLSDSMTGSSVHEGLLLGSLAIISLLIGMLLRMRSYFLVGTIVLLLNLIIQTRQYWGSMPLWGYLLIGGSILMVVASANEWNKQKINKGQITMIQRLKIKWKDILKNWR